MLKLVSSKQITRLVPQQINYALEIILLFRTSSKRNCNSRENQHQLHLEENLSPVSYKEKENENVSSQLSPPRSFKTNQPIRKNLKLTHVEDCLSIIKNVAITPTDAGPLMSSPGFNYQEGSLSNTNSVSSHLEESLSNTIPVSSHREESLSNTILVSSHQEDSANEQDQIQV